MGVVRGDARYDYLTSRGYNTRFVGRPDVISQVFTPEHVVASVAEAVRTGDRLVVRGGAHCIEGLAEPGVGGTWIDMSEMGAVDFDPALGAISVEAGATLGTVYRTLNLRWGVTIPAGTCPGVGVGGHVTGGGFGALCRREGLVVDHLRAVEVVVVDQDGQVRIVRASNDPTDPEHDLFWAHTGGGGGSFGVVTKYWFRSPFAEGDRPGEVLVSPPGSVLHSSLQWSWSELSEDDFARIVRNHGAWHAANSGDATSYDDLYSCLYLNQRTVGHVVLNAQLDADRPAPERRMSDYFAAVTEGVGTPCAVTHQHLPWMSSALRDVENRGAYTRCKGKGAHLRRPFDDTHISAVYRRLSEADYDGHTVVALFSFGGRVNTVDPAATAVPHRDSILRCFVGTFWVTAADDDRHLDRTRQLYAELFAASGGVPASNEFSDGTYIGYPDTDLVSPVFNTSGVPWHALYFGDNYHRLQRTKQRFDPHDVFRHPLSIRIPGSA